ncbi:hypothetical protein GGD70_003127 [Paraburkholderia fungorum]|jgi:hypothetical protein|nr:hypothetical protein [Paraburkholderia fungorum]
MLNPALFDVLLDQLEAIGALPTSLQSALGADT